jgi:hypothetical protein
MSVAAHYRKKLEKDDIKRLSKEVAKKLVRGDYKSGRVKDPTAKLSSKHEKTVKNYVKEFMDKAVKKKEERDKQKAARNAAEGKAGSPPIDQDKSGDVEEVEWDDDMMDIQKDIAASHDASPADSSFELKRKREGDEEPSSPKKSRTGTDELAAAPPPPPPPPPAGDGTDVDSEYASEPAVLLPTVKKHCRGMATQARCNWPHRPRMVLNRNVSPAATTMAFDAS